MFNVDFTNIPVDIKIDDCIHLAQNTENQQYLRKDYAENVIYTFPRLRKLTYIPPWFSKTYGINYSLMNKYIHEKITAGNNIYWTNQTLSYANRDIQFSRCYSAFICPILHLLKINTVIDATANQGGDTIQFALRTEVKHVISYEMQSAPFAILNNNIALYHLEDKITSYNKRFDYKIGNSSFIMIDPPFESGNNSTNFTLSIEAEPIYNVVEHVLTKNELYLNSACNRVVMLNMPTEFKYNSTFAEEHGHICHVYRIPQKNIKKYIITKNTELLKFGKNYSAWNVYGNAAPREISHDYEKIYEYKLVKL